MNTHYVLLEKNLKSGKRYAEVTKVFQATVFGGRCITNDPTAGNIKALLKQAQNIIGTTLLSPDGVLYLASGRINKLTRVTHYLDLDSVVKLTSSLLPGIRITPEHFEQLFGFPPNLFPVFFMINAKNQVICSRAYLIASGKESLTEKLRRIFTQPFSQQVRSW